MSYETLDAILCGALFALAVVGCAMRPDMSYTIGALWVFPGLPLAGWLAHCATGDRP